MTQPSTAKRGMKALEVHGEATRRVAMEPERGWDRFLRGLPPLASERALELWQALERSGIEIPPPYAAATESGGLSMTWDRGRHHFEIELLSSGTYDWFYMDRDSEERSGEDAVPLSSCTPEMFSYLRKTLGETWRS
jgi:hypothetical protein